MVVSKILICSTQYPYYGGAATNAYALYKHCLHAGKRAAILFIGSHPENTNYDPENLGNVFYLSDIHSPSAATIRESICRNLDGIPELILAKNYVAPIVGKQLFPKSKVVYLISGSPVMTHLASQAISAQRFLNTAGIAFTPHPAEATCIAYADLVVPNSPLTHSLFSRIYGLGKLAATADTSACRLSYPDNNIDAGNWYERKYDIGFVCSRMNRNIKNPEFAVRLFRSRELENKKRIAVGSGNHIFTDSVIQMDLVPHDKLQEILTHTKTIICPSFFDSSPNILREALVSGCNVVLSENCGWSSHYHPDSVCRDVYDQDEWIGRILKSLEGPVQPPIFPKFDITAFVTSLVN